MADESIDNPESSGEGAAPPPPPVALPVNIEDEVRRSFLDYSMSVIISRALPDVRDGLKPVHRRILYAMQQEGLLPNRAYSKSAGVVGEVLKHMLRDIDRETVDFVPNFDGSVEEPVVLPTRFPNLLANGSSGIAVGMATNVPPHNLRELVDALVLEARNPDCTLDDLLEKIPGPDFPTGAMICGSEGIRSAYATGRGLLTVRARAEFEETKKGQRIVVSEIPFMVNKASLLERIADLVREGRIDGVSDLRDESNRQGMRIVIELRRDAPEEVVLNQLYKQTPLQSTFGVNLLALVNGRPQLLSLKEALRHFIDFRGQVVVRRATYDLAQAEARAHLLEGFAIALENLDEVIAIIRGSQSTAEARAALIGRFELSELQANAILDMRLRALTQMERQRVLDELEGVRAKISELEELLGSDEHVLEVIIEEIEEIRERFGDERRTELGQAVEGLSTEDLIVEEDMVVTVSHLGYIKRNAVTQYRAQR
ncbi:MAG: DNA gyrase subunit A, partial [Deltaproteobacteria bacterium]|nr:DNA gyrase subunit A [Deltaproteobacteria bacterium]